MPLALVAVWEVSPPSKSCTSTAPFSSAQPASIMNRLVRFAGRIGLGPSVTNSTVWSSTTRTSTMEFSSSLKLELADCARSIENATSSAVNAWPPWKVTPWRSSNTQTFGSSSLTDQLVASAASGSPVASRISRGS